MADNAEVAQHEQQGGETNLSFKEVESLTSEISDSEAVQQARQMVKERAAQKEQVTANAKKMVENAKARKDQKEAEDQANDGVGEAKQANREAPKDQSAKDLEGAKQDMSDQVEADLVAEIKKLNAKFQDSEIEIPAEAILKHKVDGEDVDVTVQDLLNNYAGKVPYDKRFQELDNDKRNFRLEKNEIQNYIETFNKKFEEGGTLDAMIYLAELGGKDPLEVRRQFRADAVKMAEQFSQLDENQRVILEKNEENEFLQQRLETDKSNRETELQNAQTLKEIRELQQTHDLNDEAILKMNDELIEAGIPPEQVTPKLMQQYLQEESAYKQAEAVLGQIDANLLQDNDAVETLKKVAIENSEFTEEDLLDIAKAAYGIKDKKVSKKVKAAAEKTQQEKEASKPTIKKKSGPLFFSDLD